MKSFILAIVLSAATAASADPAADKLFAEAKVFHERAEKHRAMLYGDAVKIVYDETMAGRDDFEAHLLTAKALAILKADANKVKAHELRGEAHLIWEEALQALRMSHNYVRWGAVHRHRAAELEKAAGILKDQPAVAAGLKADAERNTKQSKHDDEFAAKNKATWEELHMKAHNLNAQAEKLDPETQKKVAIKPAEPKTPPAPPIAASQALARLGK
jgi:hypothetical protein